MIQAETPNAGKASDRSSVRPRAALAMYPDLPDQLFGGDVRTRLSSHVDVIGSIDGPELELTGDWLASVELLIACWGAPLLDEVALARMPALRGVVYAAGSVRNVMTPAAYARGIRVSSAASLNALPVAEFTLGAILLSGKRAFAIDREYRDTAEYRPESTNAARWGNFGLRVGIVSASRIGRRVIELLMPFDVEVLVWDPTLEEDVPGARRVELDELLGCSDVVSVHAPTLITTEGLIGRRELGLLRDGATIINTARGSIIDQDALVDELTRRRIHAVIDVTVPDELPSGHPLLNAPNLFLTPHIAGSQGLELHRLGDAAVAEARRFAGGEPFHHDVAAESLALLA